MMRRDWLWTLTRRYASDDVRAGWIDARRTDSPRPLRGFRLGGLDYGIGYAAGCLS